MFWFRDFVNLDYKVLGFRILRIFRFLRSCASSLIYKLSFEIWVKLSVEPVNSKSTNKLNHLGLGTRCLNPISFDCLISNKIRCQNLFHSQIFSTLKCFLIPKTYITKTPEPHNYPVKERPQSRPMTHLFEASRI